MLAFLRADARCQTVLVEKTDRLYRNIRDWVTVDEFTLTVHFVKENAVISKDSRSSEKFLHGIKVLMAKNYVDNLSEDVDNLSEEVKKGLREKAEQGHWPSAAPVGYVNNLATHRIEVDPVRGSLIRALFEVYATGEYSLQALAAQARSIGLTHPRSRRPMLKAEIHRILQNPIYVGDFRWLGTMYAGSHEPLVPRELFEQVQSVLRRKPRTRYPKQKHTFMGLLTCGRCGCAITAERKKGKYTYYRCTGYRGKCGNTYVREEQLADLLGDVVERIQIPTDVADWIAEGLRDAQDSSEQTRRDALSRLTRQRQHVQSKLDRAYGRLPGGAHLRRLLGAEIRGMGRGSRHRRGRAEPTLGACASLRGHGPEDFRTRKTRLFPLRSAGFRRTASVARYGAIELHLRQRKSLSDLH